MFSKEDAPKHQPACNSEPKCLAWLQAAESFIVMDRLKHGHPDVAAQKRAAIEHANIEYTKHLRHGLH